MFHKKIEVLRRFFYQSNKLYITHAYENTVVSYCLLLRNSFNVSVPTANVEKIPGVKLSNMSLKKFKVLTLICCNIYF